MKKINKISITVLFITAFFISAYGQNTDTTALAKKTQNPVAPMISVPFQNNTNIGIGPHDRTQNVLNIQPVIPVNIGKLNLINRIIMPVIHQPEIQNESGSKNGLGDINATCFFSPAKPGKLIWGIGPALLLPTATDEMLGTGKFGIGPSAVLVSMMGKWVFGALANNIWSVAGKSDRGDVNTFLVQPFVNYNLPDGWSITSAPIITANWKADSDNRWVVPVGIGVGKVLKVGKLPLNVSLQGYYNVVTPDAYGADWTIRAVVSFLFPK